MKHIARALPIFLLLLLYVYAIVSKLGDYQEFRGQLHNQNFHPVFADMLSIALPVLELLTVVLIIAPKTASRGLLLSLTLLTAFTAYIALVKLGYWARVPCSCGGILNKMGWTAHLVFNCCFIAINLIAIAIQRGEAENPEQSRHHLTT